MAAPTAVRVHQENGSQVTFYNYGGSTWSAPPHVDATLTTTGIGTPQTWTFTRRGVERFTFETVVGLSTGRLTSIRSLTDPATGYTTAVTYPSSTQTLVTDPAGRTLTFRLNAAGKITQVADSTSRVMSFSADGSGNLTAVTGLNSGSGASTWAFGYQATSHRLTTMRKPNEGPGTTPVITNVYDTSGRVLRATRWAARPCLSTRQFQVQRR